VEHLAGGADVGHRDRLAAAGFVTVNIPSGMFSGPTRWMNASSFSMSMLPLKGARLVGSSPSSTSRLTGLPPRAMTLAWVVSKCMLLGTDWPGLTVQANRTFSAARPWWVGTK
jgi:hypothetical protein